MSGEAKVAAVKRAEESVETLFTEIDSGFNGVTAEAGDQVVGELIRIGQGSKRIVDVAAAARVTRPVEAGQAIGQWSAADILEMEARCYVVRSAIGPILQTEVQRTVISETNFITTRGPKIWVSEIMALRP